MSKYESKIEELINGLCPSGVEFKVLGELCTPLKKDTLKTSELSQDGKYPVINSGRDWYGYYDKYNNDENALVIAARGEYAGYINYVDQKFWAGGLCYPYRSKDENLVQTKFIFFYLKDKQENIRETLVAHGSIPALNKTDIDKFKIPLPPLPIQEEIVKILNNFTKLEAELEAELEARKKQYEYYHTGLFSFGDNIEPRLLGDIIISLKTGLNPRKNFTLNTPDAKNYYVTVRELNGGNVRFFEKTDKVNDEALKLINSRSNLESGDILFSGTGTIGRTALVEETPTNWNIKEGVYVIKPNKKIIRSKFLLFFLNSQIAKKQIEGKIVGLPVMSIPMSELKKIKVPCPDIGEQDCIIKILDKFDALVNDISIGLPAELLARRQQYEYYRNKLLSFKELP